jgi:hypothetical protein
MGTYEYMILHFNIMADVAIRSHLDKIADIRILPDRLFSQFGDEGIKLTPTIYRDFMISPLLGLIGYFMYVRRV